ncbi:MAG: DUF1934 domain-containing protein [Lachnospiraceae bacterium]|nr:DUF1934 domain-containing protein [Lachnospiraceae bacterium]
MEKDRKIPVTVTVTGRHEQDGITDKVEDVYTGFLSKRGSSTYIVYEDTENKLNNRIKVIEGKLEIKRTPAALKEAAPSSYLAYSHKETVSGYYSTPYGNIEMETFTESFEIKETESAFYCRLCGNINMNGSPVSKFTLEIEAAVK